MRYTIGTFKTRERAEETLEEMFSTGEICEGERPRVEPVRDHQRKVVRWALTQEG